jgi:hypothetical protein
MIENVHLLMNVILYFLNFSYIVILMFVVTFNYSYFNMYRHILTNWSLGPVMDIKSSDEICPQGYEKMVDFTFPGIREGCNCLNMNNTRIPEAVGKLLNGQCTIMLNQFGCETVNGISRYTVNTFNGNTLCIRRLGEFNYLMNYTNIFEQECPRGTYDCGVIDSLDNRLCTTDLNKCPNRQLLTAVGGQSDLYIQFQLSQGDVCVNNDEINLIGKRYELYENRKYIKCNTTIGSLRYDKRYARLKDYPSSEIFERNFTDKFKSLPDFPNVFDNNFSLYGRKYIGWSKHCQNLMLQFTTLLEVIGRIEFRSTVYLIASLFTLIYCMFFIMILKELLFEQYKLKLALVIVHAIFMLVMLSYIFSDHSAIETGLVTISIVIEKNCSDMETNLLFIEILKFLSTLSKLYLATVLLLIIGFAICLYKIILIITKMKKRQILRVLTGGRTQYIEMLLLV